MHKDQKSEQYKFRISSRKFSNKVKSINTTKKEKKKGEGTQKLEGTSNPTSQDASPSIITVTRTLQ